MTETYRLQIERQRNYDEKEARAETLRRAKLRTLELEAITAQEVWEAKSIRYFPN